MWWLTAFLSSFFLAAANCCIGEVALYGTRVPEGIFRDLQTAYSLAHTEEVSYEARSKEELLVHMNEGDPVVLDSLQYVPIPNTSLTFEIFGFPIVLVYGSGISSLDLTQEELVNIFTGNITMWSELAQARFASVGAPSIQPINLVVPDSALTDYFFMGLSAIAQRQLERSLVDTLAATIRVDVDDVCRRVNTAPFSIGISWMGDAITSGTSMARLQNNAGVFAQPEYGAASAMTEFRALQLEARRLGQDQLALHAVNMPGRLSWPLMGVVTLVLPTKMENCDLVNKIRHFVTWILLEDATQPLMRLLGWEPATTLDLLANVLGASAVSNPILDIEDALNGIMCDGKSEIELSHTIASSDLFWPLLIKLIAGYSGVENFLQLTSSSTNITTLLTRMAEGEASGEDVDLSFTWQSVIENFPSLYAVPVLMGAVTPLVNLGNLSIILSVPLLSRIFASEITHWNDPQIRALNPTITLPNKEIVVFASPINHVDGSSAMFASLLTNNSTSFSWSQVNATIDEGELMHHVKFTPYSIGYSFGHLVPNDDLFLVPHLIGKAGRITELALLRSCWTSPTHPDCWPMSIPLALALRQPGGDVTCEHQQQGVKFLDWVLDNNVELEPFLIPNPEIDPALGQAEYCNGRSLLETKVEPQFLSESVIVVVRVLCTIGILWTVCHGVALIVARNQGELKSASVLFSLLAVGGVFLMLVGPLLVMSNEPSNVKCGASEFVVAIGFSLTYGSLFSKLYRLYKIFTSKSLVVPRLGNRKLLLILTMFVCIDLVLLIVECATDLLEVDTFDVMVRSSEDLVTGYRHLQWRMCDYELADLPLNILLSTKLAVATAGAFMAFSVRQVDRRFASATALGWCFYNMFLVIFLVILLATVFRDDSNPSTNLSVVVFGGIWILFVTLFALAFDSNVIFALHVVSKPLRRFFQSQSSKDNSTKGDPQKESPENSKKSNTSTIFIVNREMFPSKYDDFDTELLEKILEELNHQRTAVRRVLLNVNGTSTTGTQMAPLDARGSVQIAVTKVDSRFVDSPSLHNSRKVDESPKKSDSPPSPSVSVISTQE